MGLAELVTGLGSATMDTAGRLSATEARRPACDAGHRRKGGAQWTSVGHPPGS